MPSGHLIRQALLASATAIVARPLHQRRGGIASFAIGWPTGELAPQLLAASALDTALAVRRGRTTPLGVALSAASIAGLGWAIRQARRSAPILADGLAVGTGTPPKALPRTPVRTLARPFHFRDPRVRVERDIAYGTYGARSALDIYRPATGVLSDAPVLLQIHGGAWTIGTKEQQGLLLMNRMAAQGWVCVAINYRLAPRDRWPSHIDDVRSALAWVRENIAGYGGDPDHIVLTGGSAGGHLSSLAALTAEPGTVAGCVPFYGIYDVLGEDQDVYTIGLRDGFLTPRVFAVGAIEDDFRGASPIWQITEDAPDFFVLHGSNDSLVSVRQARAFVNRLRDLSQRSVTYAELPGAQHAFDIFGSIRSHHAVDAVDRWLRWHHAERQAARRAAAG